ncbi:hypothetical protein THMIRHAM_06660 [Thiomicrorhabdus immobilis]|uniref:Porin domain-containing protein n=1 Tax=Thiomicrorhabdus immobilis TaxID=2791037 RepID=A0ABM7MC02_9GAMM|nr:porin [Thiomicrorhabdus immobilis]BCN92881.1 hypothetical protein THMIRHAM_06660 [Thiomicrorhabdus immobilis]
MSKFISSFRPKKILVALLLAGSSPSVWAYAITPELELKGFVAQDYVHTNRNPYATSGTLDNGSFDFREAGLNLNWQVTPKLRFNTQLLAREEGEMTANGLSLDLALLDYNFLQTQSQNGGVRLGRVKTPYGFYNDSRDLPSARPGIFLPSIYFDNIRSLMLSTDGINLYDTLELEQGSLSFDAYYGHRQLDDKTLEYKYLSQDYNSVDFKQLDKAGLKIQFEPTSIQGLSLAYSLLNIESSITPAPATLNGFTVNKFELQTIHHLVSVQYRFDNVFLTAEGMRARNHVKSSFTPNIEMVPEYLDAEGYYLQAEWAISPEVSTLVRYEEYTPYLDSRYKSGSNYSSNSYNLAVRWNLSPSWMVQAQYAKHEGNADLPSYPGLGKITDFGKSWDLFALQISYQLN